MDEQPLTQFKTEGSPAFPVENTGNDNPAPSSGETTTTDQTPSSEGEHTQADKKDDGAGFADHPRWKERETDWTKRFNEQEQRHVQEIEKLRKEVEGKIGKDTPSKVPSWFGGDEQQWAEYQEYNKNLVSQAEENAIKRLAEKSEQEQKAIAAATEFFTKEVAALEADKTLNPQGEKIDRNKLLKTAQDFDLVDSKGRWNYRAAFMFMKNQSARTDTTNDRKQFAGATTSENRAETKVPNVMTSADFHKPGNRPW